jgi:hypothetical protein
LYDDDAPNLTTTASSEGTMYIACPPDPLAYTMSGSDGSGLSHQPKP